MKALIVLLLVLASGLSFSQTFREHEAQDRTSALQSASRLGPAFQIPADDRWASPDNALSALKATASRLHVNIILSNAGYDTRNKPEITQYVLLTGPTRLSGEFSIKSGRWITATESESGSGFVASAQTGEKSQVGVIRSFANSSTLAIRPLSQAYVSLPVAGVYYIETYPGSSGDYDDFIRTLGSLLAKENGLKTAIQADSFIPTQAASPIFPAPDEQPLTLLGWALVAAVGLLAIYRTLSLAKAGGVMRLQGYSALRAWFLLNGRLVLVTMGLLVVAALAVAALVVKPTTESFVVDTTRSLLVTTFLMVASTAFAGLYLSRLRLQESIKNRKDTKGIFAINSALNIICAVSFVVFGSGIWTQYSQISQEYRTLKDWAGTGDYGIFYPTSIGSDLIADQSGQAGPTVAEALKLYPALNKRGALYIDATQFEPHANSTSGAGVYQSLTANPNYLSRYPIRLADGGSVVVSEKTTDWVLLAPEHYRSQQAQVLSFFQNQRRSALEAERSLFGDEPPSAIQTQQVKIIWTADNQQIFAFNPNVGPKNGNRLTDPIVQVITNSNSLGVDRANAVTGGANTALKVQLGTNGSTATLTRLQPVLKELGLSLQLRHLVTMNGYLALQAESLRQTARLLVITAAVVGLTSFGFLIQGVVIALERYGRRAAVRRLFGFSMLTRYREFIRLFLGLLLAQIVIAPLLVTAGVTVPGASEGLASKTGVTLLVAIGFSIAEILTFTVALAYFGHRRFSQVLKEGF